MNEPVNTTISPNELSLLSGGLVLPTQAIVQIQVNLANSVEWGTGTLVPGGFVLTAAHVVASLGYMPPDLGAISIISRKSLAKATVQRAALLDRWTSNRSPLADMALLDVNWQGDHELEPIDVHSTWSTVDETKRGLLCGYEPEAGSALWQATGDVTHLRSDVGLEFYGSKDLHPLPGASGGPVVSIEASTRLVGVITGTPSQGVFSQVALPLSVDTYGSLRKKLEQ